MAELLSIEPERGDPSIVGMLEEVLSDARAGKLSAVGLAIVHRDGCSEARWSECPSIPAMLGSISRLSYKLNVQLDQ